MKRPRFAFPRCRFAAALIVLAVACGPLLAAPQTSKKPEKKPETDQDRSQPELQVIRLKYAEAERVFSELNSLLGPEMGKRYRMIADSRANALFVAATPEDFKRIKRYADTLDDAAAHVGDAPEKRFQVIPLGRLVPDKAFEEGLRAVLPMPGSFFVVDRARQTLILTGNDRTMQAATDFLRRLEILQDHSPPRELRVRIVWLASGLTRKGGAEIPPDLKKVREELAAIGIEGVRLVSQSVVNVTAGSEFRAEGVAQLDSPCNLAVLGTVIERPGQAATLHLSLEANRSGEAKGPPLCRLATEIATPFGQFVVLGVTPTETTTSVFVVQVLPTDGRPAPRPKK